MTLHALRLYLIHEQGYNLPDITPLQWKYAQREPNLYCSCNRLICPVCLRRRRYWHQCALLNRIEHAASSSFQTLTVTIPAIVPKKLAELRTATKTLAKGTSRGLLKDPLLASRGGFCSLEVKCSPNRIHAHAHALINADAFSPDLMDHLLREYVPSADSHLSDEAFNPMDWARYCCKSSLDRVLGEFSRPKLFLAVADAMRGLRRFESHGTLLCTGRHRLDAKGRGEPIGN